MKNEQLTILITGAGGSLGSAFFSFIKKKYPMINVIGIDNNEWQVAVQKNKENEIFLMDFEKWKYNDIPCDIIIHCGAYKHLALCEDNPLDAINNNITKTIKLFSEANKYNVDIIFISTDKAVEPTSLYGMTKAIGERITTYFNGYIARLGNLIGSSGGDILQLRGL